MLPAWRLFVLGALYFAQGLPFGFFSQCIPVLMRQAGASLLAVALSNLLALPWVLKFIWAPIFDRFGLPDPRLRRLSILLLSCGSAGVLILGMGLDPTTEALPVFVIVVLSNLLSATQDIPTDATAVETLPPSQRGLGNGAQVVGYRLGMIVGGGALLVYMDDNGWGASLGVLALCMVLCSVPLLLNGPIPRHTEVQTIPVAPVNAPHFLRLPENGSWLFVLVLYKTGDAFGTGSIKPMLVDFGAGLSEVGWLLGTLGSSSAVVGSVIGAFLTTRVRIALPLFAGLQALSLALWTVTTVWPTQSLLIASVASEHFCSGLATTALFTEMMARCRPGLGASDYTAQASTVLTAQGIATILSAVSAEQLGYTGHHALATLVASLAVWVTIRGRG